MVRSALVLLLGLLVQASAAAQSAPPEPEGMRERIEQLRADPDTPVEGVKLAAAGFVAQLYERHGFALEWTSEAAGQLAQAIDAVEADGLNPEDYLRAALARARAAADAPGAPAAERIDCDLLHSEALVRLLYHLVLGKVDPKTLDSNWNFGRALDVADPLSFVQEIIDSGQVSERIAREKPQRALYHKLVDAYAAERARAAAGGWAALPAGPALKPGVGDARVPALRARLVAGGDLEPGASSEGDAFDPALADAVRAFQARHGLTPDGVLGAGTLAELNVPVSERLSQLRVNLERARWLLHDLPPAFVLVNVAGFQVYLVRDDAIVWRGRAQVGKPYRATPIFRSDLSYLVLNPTWTVPPGIFAADILPAQRRDRGTLARKGLEVVDYDGRPVPADSIDWSTVTPRNFRYLLRQKPGPTNALGRVKFMFPNSHSVYLHDTPSRNLFDRDDRAFSSGCIRVENPLELAALLLDEKPGWDRAAIDAAIAKGDTRTVGLAKPLPVLLLYWTAWVDGEGKLQLRRDLYGRDARVAAGLAQPFRLRRAR
ncbi:MAG TPA: L,D-transpeptidase family protein [Myxococcota bacterium]|nr:L,D-transpeptidase family protein [Myxococcota bacterium]